jgi:ribonucleoside-diphosphate reductase alpha chain
MDYIFRWLANKFLNRTPEEARPSLQEVHTEENGGAGMAADGMQAADRGGQMDFGAFGMPGPYGQEAERETFQNQADAPICTECGSIMVRNGACFKCLNCGSVYGCS